MPVKNRATLLTQAETIRDEVGANANTATRVGGHEVDIVDSVILTAEANANYAPISHTHPTSDIISGTFADARIAQSNVTQHQGALSITESQISDLGTYASTTQTDFIAGLIEAPSDKNYKIVVKIPYGGTITETTTISTSGTCTATFKVNTTALGGTANSVSNVEQSQAHASTNTFSTDDDIVITISANSSCVDMSFTIKFTRTLA